MPRLSCPRGIRSTHRVPVIDPATGVLDLRWASGDTPGCRAWPGSDRPYRAIAASWAGDPAEGAYVDLVVEAEDSSALADGANRYELLVTSGGDTTSVGTGYLLVRPAPTATGDDSAPRSYATIAEFRSLARPAWELLGTNQDQAGLANVLGMATADLDGEIAERYAGWSEGQGPDAVDYARTSMLAVLEAGGLTVTQPIRRYVVFRALWYLTAFTPAKGDLARVADLAMAESERAKREVVASVAGPGGRVVIRFGGPVRIVR